MAHRSQCSSNADNPLDPNYLPPHYREEYRLAIDALVEENLEGYHEFLKKEDCVDFLSTQEVEYIQSTVRVPQKSSHPEQRYLECGGDGSSDTYWPMHSDVHAPDLDLGWPQLLHFIGPTEVTTLVNPAEPDMPTIKQQARRLIKNAQKVIAIVMDMFTDVDILQDVVAAAMRNVAVYILLDEQHAHHFTNMLSNCRVNLKTIQNLRVRTVSGITYHLRSGKSFTGQMMDRFLLTDCRAVLSGNYSFMWSFEKIHRCMAHLFLGQLVSTFDVEFRILYAQSQPLIIENVLASIEGFSHLPERQYRKSRKCLPESMHRSLDQGPVDMYNMFPTQQLRMDPSYEQGHSRMPINERLSFKRHSYAEGVPGRPSSFQILQQLGMPTFENQGRQFQRGQPPYPRAEPEADHSGYDTFLSHGYPSADQHSDPGLPLELEPSDDFNSVHNYLSSISNVDFDQISDKSHGVEVALGSSHPKRLSVGQPYACQISPTHPNPPDQKPFFQEPNIDRKDPMVKLGLRNWRLSSYLSASDNAGDEVLPLQPPQETDPFEEPSNRLQGMASGAAAQWLSKLQAETKIPTTPSESSSTTTDGDKMEEVEPKEPKTAVLRRDDSFHRKSNAPVKRKSRMRSSLIFGSQLEEQDSTVPGQHIDDIDNKEDDPTELPFASKYLDKMRPLYFSRFGKSATFDLSTTETSKADDIDNKAGVTDSQKMLKENNDIKELSKSTEVDPASFSPWMPDQPSFYVDMSDADHRLMFFKELAAQRKAANTASAEKSTEKEPQKPPSEFKNTTTVKKEESETLSERNAAENAENKIPTSLHPDVNETTNKKNESKPSHSSEEKQTRESTDSEKIELKNSQASVSLTVPTGSTPAHSQPTEKTQLSNPVAKESSPGHLTKTDTSPTLDLTSESSSLNPSSVDLPPSTKSVTLESNQSLGPLQLDSTVPGQHDEETDKNEDYLKKYPFFSRLLGQRKHFEWSRYGKSASFDVTTSETSKADDIDNKADVKDSSRGNNSKDLIENNDIKESSNPAEVDMSDADNRLMFFKELAAKRKAAKTASGEKSTEKEPGKPPSELKNTTTVKKEESLSEKIAEDAGNQISTESTLNLDVNEMTNKEEDHPKNESKPSHSSEEKQTTDSEKIELKNRQASASLPVSTGSAPSHSQPTETPKLLKPAANDCSPGNLTKTDTKSSIVPSPKDSLVQSTDEHKSPTLDSTLKESSSLNPSSVELQQSSKLVTLESNQHSASSESSAVSHSIGPESRFPHPSEPSSFSDHKSDSSSQNIPCVSSPSPSGSAPHSTPLEVVPSISPEVSSSTPTSSILSPKSDKTESQESASPSPPESAQSVNQTLQESSIIQTALPSDSTTTSPSERTLTVPSAPSLAAKMPCPSPQSDSGESTVSPKAETNTSPVLSPSETNKSPVLSPSETNKSSVLSPSEINKSPVLSPSETNKSPVLSPSETNKSPVLSLSETNKSPVLSPSETNKSPVLSPSETNKSPVLSPSETNKSSVLSLSETNKSPVLSPSETNKSPVLSLSETNKSPVLSLSETNKSPVLGPSESCSSPKISSTDSSKSPTPSSTESSSDHSLTDDTSKVTPVPTEPYPPGKTPSESKPVTSESQTSVKPVPAENNNVDNQREGSKEPETPDSASEKKREEKDAEATNKVKQSTHESVYHGKSNDQTKENNSSEIVEVTSPQSKQSKASLSRYHSSTANVLSSSNLRDDTKLLLGQLSANSQCRTEPTKESAVTDDDKEDEAGKNANKEKGGTILIRGKPKTVQEEEEKLHKRQKLLEEIQVKRKERKVYSRFELA